MTTPPPSPKDEARKERQDRLAAQLRDNLKKRKAQARARRDGASKPPTPEDGG